MKFGRKISKDLYDEWRPYYIDYNHLKRELKKRTTKPGGWTETDEQEFTRLLELELDKVHDFQKDKVRSILPVYLISEYLRLWNLYFLFLCHFLRCPVRPRSSRSASVTRRRRFGSSLQRSRSSLIALRHHLIRTMIRRRWSLR